MSGPAEIWELAAGNFETTLAEVGDDQWDAPTGCGDWTVRDLVDHTLVWQCNLAATVGAAATPDDGWASLRSAISGALQDPSVHDGELEDGPMAGMPKHMAMGFATADVLLHGWDLARAIGADDTLPPAAVEAVHMGMSQAPDEMIRNPQVFGPVVEVPADASAQDQLLGFSGRRP
mgnify:FL=1